MSAAMVPHLNNGRMIGRARIYLYTDIAPEAQPPGHPGWRGPVWADALGVHLEAGSCELLLAGAEEWVRDNHPPLTIPWARIDSIEWLD